MALACCDKSSTRVGSPLPAAPPFRGAGSKIWRNILSTIGNLNKVPRNVARSRGYSAVALLSAISAFFSGRLKRAPSVAVIAVHSTNSNTAGNQ